MKKLTNKNFMQKMTIAIIIVMVFNFTIPTVSNAGVGGLLIGPITDLTALLGDIVMTLMAWFLVESPWDLENESFSGGAVSMSAWLDDPSLADKFDMNLINGAHTENFTEKEIEGSLGFVRLIPLNLLGPEKIFGGEVPALDINFINPKKRSR